MLTRGPGHGRRQCAAAAADGPRTNAAGAAAFTLANGMQLIVQPDARAPTARAMVWLRVDSMDEVDGTSGVAHVLEHMMFQGSKTVAPGDFSPPAWQPLGGRENAFTSPQPHRLCQPDSPRSWKT